MCDSHKTLRRHQKQLTALTAGMPREQRPAVREEAGRAGAVEALLAVLRGSSHEPALQARLRPVLAASVHLPACLQCCPRQHIGDALWHCAHTTRSATARQAPGLLVGWPSACSILINA